MLTLQDKEELTLEKLRLKPPSHLLTPEEVAYVFRVDPKTVTRWAQAKKLSSRRTLGGHRRYLVGEVVEKLSEEK